MRTRPSTTVWPFNWLISIRLVSDPALVTFSRAALLAIDSRSMVAVVSSVVVPAAPSVTSK